MGEVAGCAGGKVAGGGGGGGESEGEFGAGDVA